jgi:Protein of unknown function (DUF2946)
MGLSLARRRLSTWIAIFAVLLAALVPAVSHALGPAQGAAWFEVCSAQGSRWVQDGADDSNGAPSGLLALEHCPACASHAPALGLPPAPFAGVAAPDLGDALPQAFLEARRTLHAWASAQPRAPPPLS